MVINLFNVLKPKFNPKTDLLLISKANLEEAESFDDEGWFIENFERMIVLDNHLKNIAIVRSGYSTNLV